MGKFKPPRRPYLPKFPYKGWVLSKELAPKEITLVQISSSFTTHLHREHEGWTHNERDIHKSLAAAIRSGRRKLALMTLMGKTPAEKLKTYGRNLDAAEAGIATAAH